MSTTPNTRAEHHADSTVYQVRQSRRVVHRALEAGHVGRENAIHGSELEQFVPVAETTVRDCIAELRDDPEGPPIGNCSDGYFIIDSPAELERFVGGVKDEIATKRDRLEATVSAYNRRNR